MPQDNNGPTCPYPGKSVVVEKQLPRILVCILHYGDPALTRRLHRQLLESDPAWAENIRVLDNAAPQSYAGAYSEDNPNVTDLNVTDLDKDLGKAWERLPENIYWAGALDFALDRAGHEGFSHLWFFNNDTVFVSKPPYLARAAERLDRLKQSCGPVGVYSPAVVRNPYHPQMIADPKVQWRQVAYVDGIAPLLSLDAVRDVGGLDAADNIFGYGADIWLSSRIARSGWSVLVDNQLVMKHDYHATARKTEGFLDKAAMAEQAFMISRLGPDYKQTLKSWQADCRDEFKI